MTTTLTNDASIQYKFANGTSGFGSPGWAGVEKQTNGSAEINNRVMDIVLADVAASGLLVTNVLNQIATNGDVAPAGVQAWAAVPSTYSVTNINVTIVCVGVLTNDSTGALGGSVTNGQLVDLFGGIENWDGGQNTAAVGGTVSYSFTNYAGGATVPYQLRTASINGSWDEGGANASFVVPASMIDGGTLVVTNSTSVWRKW